MKTAVGPLLDNLNASFNAVKADITKQWTSQWKSAVVNLNSSALGNLKNQIQTATNDGQKIARGIQRILQDVQDGIQQIKAAQRTVPAIAGALTHLVQEQFAAYQQAVMNASATPGALSSLFAQYLIAAQGIVVTLSQGISQLQALVAAVAATEVAAKDQVASVVKQALALRDQLNQMWLTAGKHRPLPELADISAELAAGPLANFSKDLQQKLTDLATAVTDNSNTFLQRPGEHQQADRLRIYRRSDRLRREPARRLCLFRGLD